MIERRIGNYRLVDKIGEGGMGAVFKAFDCMLEREVAIKMLRPELSLQPQIVERFHTEAIALAKLNHTNIATVYSFLRYDDDYFMVLEYVPGNTLARLIKTHGAMSVEHAISLFGQALDAVSHAHEMGVIHRDIKPANILLNDTGVLKLTDFGIARVIGTARITRNGGVVGTAEYMSPEQILGEEGDERSDIYSLGILLYEMLLGRVPFESDSEFALMKSQVEALAPPPRSIASHIPLEIEEAIMRSLAKKPEARFQSALEFRAALDNSLLSDAFSISESLPVDKARLIYAAPVTRIDESLAADGEDGLADAAQLVSLRSETSAACEREIGETRLDGSLLSLELVGETMLAGAKLLVPPLAEGQAQETLSLDGSRHQAVISEIDARPPRWLFAKRRWMYRLTAPLLVLALAVSSILWSCEKEPKTGKAIQPAASTPHKGASPQSEQNSTRDRQADDESSSAYPDEAEDDRQDSAMSGDARKAQGDSPPRRAVPRRAKKKEGRLGGLFKKVIPFSKGN